MSTKFPESLLYQQLKAIENAKSSKFHKEINVRVELILHPLDLKTFQGPFFKMLAVFFSAAQKIDPVRGTCP